MRAALLLLLGALASCQPAPSIRYHSEMIAIQEFLSFSKTFLFPAVTLKVPYVDLASLVSGGLQLKRDVVRGVGNIASSAVRAKLAYAGAVAGANAYSLRQHLISQRPADDIHMSF